MDDIDESSQQTQKCHSRDGKESETQRTSDHQRQGSVERPSPVAHAPGQDAITDRGFTSTSMLDMYGNPTHSIATKTDQSSQIAARVLLSPQNSDGLTVNSRRPIANASPDSPIAASTQNSKPGYHVCFETVTIQAPPNAQLVLTDRSMNQFYYQLSLLGVTKKSCKDKKWSKGECIKKLEDVLLELKATLDSNLL
ncbi:MAG: hypothetical protein Q9188_001285 [Gyalolechia gomerana]